MRKWAPAWRPWPTVTGSRWTDPVSAARVRTVERKAAAVLGAPGDAAPWRELRPVIAKALQPHPEACAAVLEAADAAAPAGWRAVELAIFGALDPDHRRDAKAAVVAALETIVDRPAPS